MSNYKKHTQFNLFVALPILVGSAYFVFHPSYQLLMTFALVFTYTTLFMSPDMDLANQIRLFSIRGLFSLPFRSYAKFFSHRGLSHHVLLGSLTRIFWLAGWGTLIFLGIYKSLPHKKDLLKFYSLYQPYFLYALAGVCSADWGHLLLDRKSPKPSNFSKKK